VAFQQRQVSAQWVAVEVGVGGRSLDLAYITGGCLQPGATATVAESKVNVTISVHQVEDIPGPGEGCSEILGRASLVVPLAAPLDGRPILSAPAQTMTPFSNDFSYWSTVPRLIGFSPNDAMQALKLKVLHERVRIQRVHTRRGLPRVVAQSPAPGANLTEHGAIHLRIAVR
jgi:hypothetical protein